MFCSDRHDNSNMAWLYVDIKTKRHHLHRVCDIMGVAVVVAEMQNWPSSLSKLTAVLTEIHYIYVAAGSKRRLQRYAQHLALV